MKELNYEQARLAFEQAIEIDPNSAKAYRGLADTWIAIANSTKDTSDYEQAKAICEKLISIDSSEKNICDYMDICFIYTEENISHKNYDGAIQIIQDVKIIVNNDNEEAVENVEERITKIEIQEKEIENLLAEEKEREEGRKKEEQWQLEAQKIKEREELNKEIRTWLLRKLGLITKYPVNCGYSKDDPTIYYLLFGYDGDYYSEVYTFSIDGDIWTITEHERYDMKSGELYPDSKGVGNSYDFTITDEIEEKYLAHKEKQKIFTEYAEAFNRKLETENDVLHTDFNMRESYLEEYNGENELIGTFVYWEKESSFFTTQIIMKVRINTETNEISFINVSDNGSGEREINLSEYSGTVVLEQ